MCGMWQWIGPLVAALALVTAALPAVLVLVPALGAADFDLEALRVLSVWVLAQLVALLHRE